MILIKSGQTVPFVPAWLRDQPDPPVFHLRVGSVAERAMFEATLDGDYDAPPVYDFTLRAAAVAGVQHLGGEDAARLTDLIFAAFGDEEMDAADRATADELFEVLHEHWSEYRALRKQQARRLAVMPVLAFSTWVTGWENVMDAAGQPVPFAHGATGRVDDAALRRIPEFIVMAVGAEAVAMQYGRGEEKNFAPPSPSAATRESSSSDATAATAG